MRILVLTIAMAGVLAAQDTQPAASQTPPVASQTPPVASQTAASQTTPAAAQTTTAAPAAPPPAQSPVPSGENALTGSLDLGYRWVTTVHGSFDTYRSIVDLNSGPKLLGAEFTLRRPESHPNWNFFDRIDVRAYNWGDDPYSTLHVDVQKAKIYDFSGDYRSIAYYSNLPGFADPLMTTGATLNEQSLDTRIRTGAYRLELLPGHWFVPYLEYERNSTNGTGVATFVAGDNEYPVSSLLHNATDNYRGGVRIELSRLHLKLEQGGTIFRDSEQLSLSQPGTNYGNSLVPIAGQTLDVNALSQALGVRGTGPYTTASLVANPASWIDLSANFLYSEPSTTANFNGLDYGNNVVLSQILFYTGEQDLITGLAKTPHTSASAGAEIRPFKRLRVLPMWLTDRMHTSGSSSNFDDLTTSSGLVPVATLLSSSLVTNFNQAGMTLAFDLMRNLTVRAGYRYEWGNSTDVILPIAELVGLEYGHLRRNVALAGVAWHPVQTAWINLDYEEGSSGSDYFRTSLYNYQKARARGRYRVGKSVALTASASVLNNSNPQPNINYSFLSHQESASVLWTPYSGKYFDFEGSYMRSTLSSNIYYLDPEFLIPEQSFYRDNSHTVTALLNVNAPGWLGRKTKLTLGGTAFLSSGSNPTTFYQPTARLAVALAKNVTWLTEWHYYGFNQVFYNYQAFRTDTVMTGVRLTR